MKIKREHLEQLMEYIRDEEPKELNVSTEENGFAVSFSFSDKENRDCKVLIYEATISSNQPPKSIKSMDLKTRLPKKQDGDK